MRSAVVDGAGDRGSLHGWRSPDGGFTFTTSGFVTTFVGQQPAKSRRNREAKISANVFIPFLQLGNGPTTGTIDLVDTSKVTHESLNGLSIALSLLLQALNHLLLGFVRSLRGVHSRP